MDVRYRNLRSSRNGRRAEKMVEKLVKQKVDRKSTIDFPYGVEINGQKIGEIKSVEKLKRKDGSGYGRITIEKRQIQELKEKGFKLLVSINETKEMFIVSPEILNENQRQYSINKLKEMEAEMQKSYVDLI